MARSGQRIMLERLSRERGRRCPDIAGHGPAPLPSDMLPDEQEVCTAAQAAGSIPLRGATFMKRLTTFAIAAFTAALLVLPAVSQQPPAAQQQPPAGRG